MSPDATITLEPVSSRLEICFWRVQRLLCHVRRTRNDFVITDPHRAWWNPSTSQLFLSELFCRQRSRHNIRNRRSFIVPNQMIRHLHEVAVSPHLPFPRVVETPILEAVPPLRASTATFDID